MQSLEIKNNFCWMLIIALILTQSCTKNELVPYEREPLNKILEYKVTNNPQHMMGVINQNNNTIKVYIPYYNNLDYLVSSITLDEGAALLRIDSTEINLLEDELEPVTVGDTVQYIVRSAEGQYRTYTLTQEVLPYDEPLSILGYGNVERMDAYNFLLHTMEDGQYPISANRVLYLFGNFMSSSSLGTFVLTNQQTGEEHKDYVRISAVEPQANAVYRMTSRIVADAEHGIYDVRLEHQGRTTDLPPLEINYALSYGTNYSSSTAYAQGDTIVFNAENAVFGKLERLFVRVNRPTREGDVPPDFPEERYGQDMEMKVLSTDRTEIKAIFPDVPVGLYRNYGLNVINLLAVFSPEEGFVEGTPFNEEVKIAVPSGLGFTVNPRD